jgi:hypothetical protein
MNDWVIYYTLGAASLLGNFVALPVFLTATVFLHRQLRSRSSLALIATVAIATFARFIRLTPLARVYDTVKFKDGSTHTAFGPNTFGTAMEILFRADIFAIAIIVLGMALAWRRTREQNAQHPAGECLLRRK